MLWLLLSLLAVPAFAQSTSSAIGGRITSAGGEAVAGADIVILHTPSGTLSRATTDAEGRYNARGLRVGGPYTVTVSREGFQSASKENVFLLLNETAQVSLALSTEITSLEAIEVVGTSLGSSVFSAEKMGSGTGVDRQTIEALPSVGGNIQDYMRLDPRVSFVNRAEGSITAGGQNPRYNAIRIDGVSASDTFGLEGNNMPTRRQPVSMEAIEAINIDLSSYDVTITGATGAVVDAVTKSGTNNFSGSVYTYYRDGDWFGDDPTGATFNGFTKEETYGGTFGGALIKDTLFFFLNYEKFVQSAPGANIAGSAIGLGRIPLADAASAAAIAQNVFGFDGGTLDSDGDTELEEYAAKFDWNINEFHRANFRYSNLEQTKLRINGFGSTSASLSSYWYNHDKSVESYVGQLFSDWTDTFSTEFKVSYRDYAAVRNTPTNGTPAIQIAYGNPNANGVGQSPFLYLGTEVNSQYNELYTKTLNIFGSGTLTLGDHDLKFGVDWSENEIYNVYAPYVDGYYTYNSLADFAADNWSYYQVRNPLGGDVNNMAADYTYRTLGFFLQDTWYVNQNLTLTMGLRADKFDTDTRPMYNAMASQFFGYDNSDVGGGDFLFQPRVGFNYTFDTDRPTQLRGGIGLFRGESPQVWLGNAFNSTGLNYTQTECFATCADTPLRQNVNFVSDDFEQPSVWKANLALDHELPWHGLVASAEALVTNTKTGLFYRRLDLGNASGAGQDGRMLYWQNNNTFRTARANRDPRFGDVLLLDTTSKGASSQLTVSLSKPWADDSDWSWMMGYTYTDATDVSGLTSSTATSGWNYNYVFQANEEIASTARYEIKDRFSGSLNWRRNLFGDYKTEVGLVYEGRSGRPYSYVFVNDVNGDSRSANDLFYVPTGPGDVAFTGGAAMEQAFFAWLEQNPELAAYAGQVAPANGFRAGWVNTFDLRFSQELPGFFKNHRSEIWLDIQNVGNLLNKDWGHIYDYGFFANRRVLSATGRDAQGRYIYNFTNPDSATVSNSDSDGFNVGVSQWSVQVGFRYKF